MLDDSIYEVLRKDYASFVEQIKPEFRDVKTLEENNCIITKIFSKKTGKHLCSRVTSNTGEKPEKYYIFDC